ncbi:MAG: NAD(P)/FAD-dependent oxidoreductase [Taibaiella sp.]|nr:NAD(P)/FAD-dependent oxidoreductase [Taibaiella sp.]
MDNAAGEVKIFDVVIIGAGPGGSTCALALRNAGLKVAIIDKAVFPRDKVCGELMHRKTVATLTRLVPEFESEFKAFAGTLIMKHTKVHYKKTVINFDWETESYTCPRLKLDDFLLSVVKKYSDTEIYTDTTPGKITVDEAGVTVTLKNDETIFQAKLIIGADGAQSTVAKQLAQKVMDKKHYLGAVRAYYKNVKDIKNDVSEVFFNSRYNLNYLWVFPVDGNLVNVGFGLLSNDISGKKINLKEAFYDYFKISPELADKFKDAEQVGPLEGFGVPLGSSVGITSGNSFMLLGDAASLSNPLSGTGMGNAILSGMLAGQHAAKCFAANNFSEEFMKEYDNTLQKEIINDLMASYKAQRILSKMPYMLDVVFWLSKFKRIKHYIQSHV